MVNRWGYAVLIAPASVRRNSRFSAKATPALKCWGNIGRRDAAKPPFHQKRAKDGEAQSLASELRLHINKATIDPIFDFALIAKSLLM